MTLIDPSYNKRLSNFSKSIFKSCKKMKKETKILTLSWANQNDKKTIMEVLQHLKKLDLVDYSAGFETIKITVTSHGKLRLRKYDDWYD